MSDRQLWLEDPCPSCGERSGLRCQTSRYAGKPTRFLHAVRGWRHRPCPTCKARAGELCATTTGRRASQPHTARLAPGRRELFADGQMWEQLEQWQAAVGLVRFSAGAGNRGSIAAVTLEDASKHELVRWSAGEGELPEALAAPVWGRYALFRGHPRVSALLMWDARERQVVLAGERGGGRFEELLLCDVRQLHRPAAPRVAVTTDDTSRGSTARAGRDMSPGAGASEVFAPLRALRRAAPTGGCAPRRATAPSAAGRPRHARGCRTNRPPPPTPAERCAWCQGPMPAGLLVEARFCSKRCRQASSRHALSQSSRGSGPGDTSRGRRAPTAKARSRHA